MAFPYVPNYGGNWQTGAGGGTPITEAALDNLETQFQSVIDLLTIRGDLPYRGAATWDRLAKGTAGQFLSCDANDPLWVDSPGVGAKVNKSADEVIISNAVFQNDNDLLFAVGANEDWFVMLYLTFASDATADIRFQWTVPAGGALRGAWQDNISIVAGGNGFAEDIGDSNTFVGTGVAAKFGAWGFWRYVGAGAAGNVQLQWRQSAAQALDTTVFENSLLLAWKL